MRREWEPEELLACWTLVDADWELIANKSGATRLGFTVMLKFFEIDGRVPRSRSEVPLAAVDYVANQLHLDAGEFGAYSLSGRTVEGLGFDLLMVSDHVAVTPDVAERYPAPFYDPFTTLAWLAGVTDRIRLGTTVLIVPYRHPLLVARMAANLDQLSGGRLVLGVGIGWARQEFAALDVDFARRGALTDAHLRAIRAAWANRADYGEHRIPIWVGGHADAGLRRAAHLGDAWHPLRLTPRALRAGLDRLRSIADEEQRAVPDVAPRIALRVTKDPLADPDRLAGEGSIDQVIGDLAELHDLGATTVVLDPFNGDPAETLHPELAWQALATVSARWNPDHQHRRMEKS